MRQLGYHAGGWRHPDVLAAVSLDIDFYVHMARRAEQSLFDLVFLTDGVALRQRDEPAGSLSRSNQNVELEPLTMLSAVAMMTRHISLIATASTTYNEPYHIARKIASLDHISCRQAGWNIVTSSSGAEAKNFNRDHHLDYDTRYDRAAEFVAVRDQQAAALRDAYIREGDPVKQRQFLVILSERLWEVMPAIILGQRTKLYGLRKNISGFVRSPSLVTPFWNIEKH